MDNIQKINHQQLVWRPLLAYLPLGTQKCTWPDHWSAGRS